MTLCHELRTPLNGVMGLLQVLQARYENMPSVAMDVDALDALVHDACEAGDPTPILKLIDQLYRSSAAQGGPRTVKLMIDKMMACANLQLGVVDSLLDYNRVSTGRGATAAREPFRLADTLDEALMCVSHALPRRSNLLFEASTSVTDAVCGEYRGDRRRIVQILINLLSNAFKATSAGVVTATARMCGCDHPPPPAGHDLVCIEVVDSGCGMSEMLVQKNLSGGPFAGGGDGGGGGGGAITTTGLGFGIVRHVVHEILGGHLRVESTIGKGTHMKVALPLERVVSTPPAPTTPPSVVASATTPPPTARRAIGDRVDRPDLPVLVVDDQEFNRDVMVSLLETIGFTDGVETADDGDTALEAIDRRRDRDLSPYAIVFMDVNMQRVNGDVATATLRAREHAEERRQPTRVVGLSAYANETTRAQCLRAGMDDYLTKPMQLKTLEATMAEVATAARRRDGRNAVAAARVAGTFESRLLRQQTDVTDVPPDFAAVDHAIVDLTTAWRQGVPNREMQLKLLRHVCAQTLDALDAHIRGADWMAASDEAHRIAGVVANVYANSLVGALRAIEYCAREAELHCDDIQSLLEVARAELAAFRSAVAPLFAMDASSR